MHKDGVFKISLTNAVKTLILLGQLPIALNGYKRLTENLSVAASSMEAFVPTPQTAISSVLPTSGLFKAFPHHSTVNCAQCPNPSLSSSQHLTKAASVLDSIFSCFLQQLSLYIHSISSVLSSNHGLKPLLPWPLPDNSFYGQISQKQLDLLPTSTEDFQIPNF